MNKEDVTSNKDARKLLDYLKELLTDRAILSCTSAGIERYFHVGKILDREILKVRGDLFLAFGICPISDKDLPKPEGPKVNLQNKIYMPTDLNNSYNFVGRILGPDGSTAKCLQQCLGVKIMIRGRGSMRDRKEEEANIGRPNWEHLNDKLHVLITVEDYENRAKARLAKATDYINHFFKESLETSDKEDKVKQMQLMELSIKKEARPISWSLNFSGLPNLDYHSKTNGMYEGIGALNLNYGCNTTESFYSHLQHGQHFGPFTNSQHQHINHQQLPQTQQPFIGHTTNPLNHINGYTTTSTTNNYPYDSTDLNTVLYLNSSCANYPNSFGFNSQQSHRLTGANSTSNTIIHNRLPMEIGSLSNIPTALNYLSQNQNNLGHLSSRSIQLTELSNTLKHNDSHHSDNGNTAAASNVSTHTTTAATTTTTTTITNIDSSTTNTIITITNAGDNNNNNINNNNNNASNNSDLLKSNYSHIYSQQQQQPKHRSHCHVPITSSDVNNPVNKHKYNTTTNDNSDHMQTNNTSYKNHDMCKTNQNTTNKTSADRIENNNSKSTEVEPSKIDLELVNNHNPKLQQDSSQLNLKSNKTSNDTSNNIDSMIVNNNNNNNNNRLVTTVSMISTDALNGLNLGTKEFLVTSTNNTSISATTDDNDKNNISANSKNTAFSHIDTDNSLFATNNNGRGKYSRRHSHLKNKALSNHFDSPKLRHQLSHDSVCNSIAVSNTNTENSLIDPVIISLRKSGLTNHSSRSGFNLNGNCESKVINKSSSKLIRGTMIQSNDVENRNNKIPINTNSDDAEWPVLGAIVNSTSDCNYT